MADVYRDILPLALGAAISPVLMLFVVGTLSASRPLTRALVFGAGALSVSVALAAVFLLGAEGTGVSDGDRHSLGAALFDLVAGAALLVLALFTLLRKPRPKPPKPHEPAEPHLGRTFLLGCGAMATNLTSLALYLPALKEIVIDGTGEAARALAAGVFIAIMLLPVELPILAFRISPERAAAALERLRQKLTAHQRKVGIGIEAVFGVYLVVKGVSHLP